jgi:uncharacterized membrane protein SpoIIM required for sporulation
MNELTFVERREPGWQKLTRLCDRADISVGSLTSSEFREFVRLYRQASADLAVVRARSGNDALAEFLNDLVSRAYAILYRAPKVPFLDVVLSTLRLVAQTARRRAAFLAASAAFFFGSILFSYAVISIWPESRGVFVQPAMEDNFTAWKEGLPARSGEESAMATSMYASNNPVAALLTSNIAAASFGIGTVYVLYQNGTIIGALARDMAGVGKLGLLVVWLAPHGVTELSGLVFSGAAGFVLAWALIAPGRKSRVESLAIAGKDAIVMLGTAVGMMFLAAPVEGFFSFNPTIPMGLKAAFAGTMACAWAAFWIGFGRNPSPPKSAAQP